MSGLAEVLELFNRKERNLLLRDALKRPGKQLQLSASFRTRIGSALRGLEIPRDAWWATDYHLNWIAAALSRFHCGKQAVGVPLRNLETVAKNGTRRLIESNQEDADLLIAFAKTLILVEVKAFGYFTNKQISSKVVRWKLLKKHADALQSDVALHFVLMSPRKAPDKLDLPVKGDFPDLDSWPHAKLNIESVASKLNVTSANQKRRPRTSVAEAWYIAPLRVEDGDESKGD